MLYNFSYSRLGNNKLCFDIYMEDSENSENVQHLTHPSNSFKRISIVTNNVWFQCMNRPRIVCEVVLSFPRKYVCLADDSRTIHTLGSYIVCGNRGPLKATRGVCEMLHVFTIPHERIKTKFIITQPTVWEVIKHFWLFNAFSPVTKASQIDRFSENYHPGSYFGLSPNHVIQ